MKKRYEDKMLSIRQSILDFLVPLKTTGVVDKDMGEDIVVCLEQLLALHKEEALIEKWFLVDLYSVPESIRNEMTYSKERVYLESLANKIERYFGMLLAGEEPTDRIPGTPRFI